MNYAEICWYGALAFGLIAFLIAIGCMLLRKDWGERQAKAAVSENTYIPASCCPLLSRDLLALRPDPILRTQFQESPNMPLLASKPDHPNTVSESL